MPQPLVRLLHHLRHHAIAITALLVALGGTSYAAFTLPANSVGTAQLKNHAITPVKLKERAIGGSVLAWAHVAASGRIYSGSPGAFAQVPPPGTPGPSSTVVGWRRLKVPASCIPLATAQTVVPGSEEGVNARLSGAARGTELDVWTYNAQGQFGHYPFYVAVVC